MLLMKWATVEPIVMTGTPVRAGTVEIRHAREAAIVTMVVTKMLPKISRVVSVSALLGICSQHVRKAALAAVDLAHSTLTRWSRSVRQPVDATASTTASKLTCLMA
jgi:hypothetical protein